MNKNTVLLLALGFGGWWLWRRDQAQKAFARYADAKEAVVLPTDSMMPGTLPMAVAGVVHDGQGLSCLCQ